MTPENSQRRPDIKPTKVAAAALAAVTSAFVGSRLGIAGTVFGAGIASVVTTVGGALYQKSLDRTGRSLRSKMGAGDDPAGGETTIGQARTVRLTRLHRPGPAPPTSESPAESPTRRLPRDARTERMSRPMVAPPRTRLGWLRWQRVVLGALGVFAVSMIAVTGVELVGGGALSGGAGGTTVGGLFAPPSPSQLTRPRSMPPSPAATGRASTVSPSTTSGATLVPPVVPLPSRTTPRLPTPTPTTATGGVTTTPGVMPQLRHTSG